MTTPAEVYDQIQLTIPADLPDKVLTILQSRRGQENKISRRALVEQVFGIQIDPKVDLNNLSEDRQVREVIAALQEDHPILSSSGRGGYWYGTPGEIIGYIGEINSRAYKLLQKSRRLEQLAKELVATVEQLELPL